MHTDQRFRSLAGALTIGSVPAQVVTGTQASAGGTVASAATVVDGVVVKVDVSGAELASDATSIGNQAVAVLELVLLRPAG